MGRILVVEDDLATREAVVKLLADSGHAVSVADNGWEALLVLDREKIDLIVLDLIMPGMDGQTFLKIMRNSQKHNQVPVVVVTAYDAAEMRRVVEPLGVVCIMGKKRRCGRSYSRRCSRCWRWRRMRNKTAAGITWGRGETSG